MATASESKGESSTSTTEEASAKIENFLNSGRTGRRNAIPDIYCPQSRVSTAELPANFARLSCDESSNQPPPSPSQSNVGPNS